MGVHSGLVAIADEQAEAMQVTSEHVAFAREFGADQVIDYKRRCFENEVGLRAGFGSLRRPAEAIGPAQTWVGSLSSQGSASEGAEPNRVVNH